MITEGFVQKCLKYGLLTCTFQPHNENLVPLPMNYLVTCATTILINTNSASHNVIQENSKP